MGYAKNLTAIGTAFALSTLAVSAQSDADRAEAFFRDNLKRSAENYVNTAVEDAFRNRFDNIEFDMAGFDKGKPIFSLRTVQPLADNTKKGSSSFFQGSLISGRDTDTLNLGFGQRWLIQEGKLLAGINVFYDNEWDAGHERASLGFELLSTVGDFRYNHYTALSDEENVSGVEEQALNGFDTELSVPLPYLPTTRLRAKSFAWEGENGADDLEGSTISLSADLPKGFQLEAGTTSYDGDVLADQDFIYLSFNLARYKQKEPLHQFVSKQAYGLQDVSHRRFEKVRRADRIVKQRGSTSLGLNMGTRAGTITFTGV